MKIKKKNVWIVFFATLVIIISLILIRKLSHETRPKKAEETQTTNLDKFEKSTPPQGKVTDREQINESLESGTTPLLKNLDPNTIKNYSFLQTAKLLFFKETIENGQRKTQVFVKTEKKNNSVRLVEEIYTKKDEGKWRFQEAKAMVGNQLLLTLEEGVDISDITHTLEELGAKVTHSFASPGNHVISFELKDKDTYDHIKNSLKEDGRVKSISPDYIVKALSI
ncbi:MAG: hypothetical protein ACOCUH_00175 [Bacteriovoracia bacterium]